MFPGGSEGKESACSAGDVSSAHGEGNGNPLQYSCMGNWGPAVHKSRKELETTEQPTLAFIVDVQ